MANDDKLNARTRKFNIELYPDNEQHKKAYSKIVNGECGALKWVSILHDKDTYEETTPEHKEGELKKPHFHVCIEYANATRRTSISNKLGIEERFIVPCDNWKASLLYLVHFNRDKYQYECTELCGHDDLIQYICENVSKADKYKQFNNIMRYISDYHGKIDLCELFNVCYRNGWVSALTRNQNFIISAITSHNKNYELKYY